MRNGRRRIEFSVDQESYLREHYPVDALCDIADYFHVSPPVIKKKVNEMGLKKSEAWSASLYRNRIVKHYTHDRYKKVRAA